MPISDTRTLLTQIEVTEGMWRTINDVHEDYIKSTNKPRVLAASSATVAELEAAKSRAADGTTLGTKKSFIIDLYYSL